MFETFDARGTRFESRVTLHIVWDFRNPDFVVEVWLSERAGSLPSCARILSGLGADFLRGVGKQTVVLSTCVCYAFLLLP